MEKVIYTFGQYRLSLPERRLWLGEKAVKVEPRELDLLLFFVKNAGELITKERLREKIWDGASLHDTTIPTAISHLRKALEAGDDEIEYIKSVPSKGYYFVCPVTTERMADGEKESAASKESAKVEAAWTGVPDNNRQAAGLVGAGLQLPESGVIRPDSGFDVLKASLPESERAEIFFDFGRKASARLIGAEQNTWLNFITDEYGNFGAALDYYGRTSSNRELELTAHLGFYWQVKAQWTEGRERLRHALARQEEDESMTKAQALTWFGHLSYHLDDYRSARKALLEGIALSKRFGDDSTLALALHGLSNVAEAEGRYPEARELGGDCLKAGQRAKADWLMGAAYRDLASIAQSQGDYAGAKELYLKSLVKREEADDKRGISSTYSRLSAVVLAQKDVAQARLFLDRSHETVYGTPGKQYVALAQFHLGLIEEAAGQFNAALAAFQKSLALRHELAEKRGVAKAMEAIAKVVAIAGNEWEAARIFGAADALRTSTGAPMSPIEQKRYGALILDVRKKFPQEWNEGSQRVLDEVIIV